MLLAGSEFTYAALLLGTFGVLLAFSALLGRPVERFGVPVVFLFLGLGMLAGSEGIGGIAFEDYRFTFLMGNAALVLILLDGGFNTSLDTVRRTFVPATILATVGVAITAGLVALFGWLLGLKVAEAVLLGAIVSSTDSAAVFAVLRGSGLRLKPRVGGTIELESGINDPMAVILTVGATAWFLGEAPSIGRLALDVPLQLIIGLAVGLAVGWMTRLMLMRVRLATAGLYPVLTLGLSLLAFGAATLAGGSGFLAVFAAAWLLGNSSLPYKSGLARIHDALGWLSQVGMFLMLGLLVFPSRAWAEAGVGVMIALFLSFVARPISVALCLLPLRRPITEIVYVGWVGLRGAVPIILATYPVLAEVPGAMRVFNIVFFIVITSAIFPGVTIRRVTTWLGMQAAGSPPPPAVLEVNSTRLLNGELLSFYVTDALAVCGAKLADIPFPPESSAVLVIRGGCLIAPRGNTDFQSGDHVYIFCRSEDRIFFELLFGTAQQE